VTYADYTASGRALTFSRTSSGTRCCPRYANTHTESSGTGLQTTRLREDARRIIRDAVGGDDETVVIFCGSARPAAIDKLIGILNLRIPADLDDRYGLSRRSRRRSARSCSSGRSSTTPTSCPWRESIADVVTIPRTATATSTRPSSSSELVDTPTGPLRSALLRRLQRDRHRHDTHRIADLLHRTAPCRSGTSPPPAPYVDDRDEPPCDEHRAATRTRSSSRRTSSSAARHAGCLVVRASC
jgi:hypothetical protein